MSKIPCHDCPSGLWPEKNHTKNIIIFAILTSIYSYPRFEYELPSATLSIE